MHWPAAAHMGYLQEHWQQRRPRLTFQHKLYLSGQVFIDTSGAYLYGLYVLHLNRPHISQDIYPKWWIPQDWLALKSESLAKYCWLRPTGCRLTFGECRDICAPNVDWWRAPEGDFCIHYNQRTQCLLSLYLYICISVLLRLCSGNKICWINNNEYINVFIKTQLENCWLHQLSYITPETMRKRKICKKQPKIKPIKTAHLKMFSCKLNEISVLCWNTSVLVLLLTDTKFIRNCPFTDWK